MARGARCRGDGALTLAAGHGPGHRCSNARRSVRHRHWPRARRTAGTDRASSTADAGACLISPVESHHNSTASAHRSGSPSAHARSWRPCPWWPSHHPSSPSWFAQSRQTAAKPETPQAGSSRGASPQRSQGPAATARGPRSGSSSHPAVCSSAARSARLSSCAGSGPMALLTSVLADRGRFRPVVKPERWWR